MFKRGSPNRFRKEVVHAGVKALLLNVKTYLIIELRDWKLTFTLLSSA